MVYGWRDDKKEKDKSVKPSSKEQSDILSVCDKELGMGRVNTWSDAGDGEPECALRTDVNNAKDKISFRDSTYALPYLQPTYLRWKRE